MRKEFAGKTDRHVAQASRLRVNGASSPRVPIPEAAVRQDFLRYFAVFCGFLRIVFFRFARRGRINRAQSFGGGWGSLRGIFCLGFLMASLLPLATFAQDTETQFLSGHGKDDAVPWEFLCTSGANSGYWTNLPVPSQWD